MGRVKHVEVSHVLVPRYAEDAAYPSGFLIFGMTLFS